MFFSDAANYSEAEKLFAEYSFYFPAEFYGPFYRSYPLLLLGRVEEAIAMLEQTLKYPERRARALTQLAWAYLYQGNIESARVQALELRRGGFIAFAGWADASIAHVAGDRERALAGIEEAASDAKVMHRSARDACRAIVLADSGDSAGATEVLMTAAAVDLRNGMHGHHGWKIVSAAALQHAAGHSEAALSTMNLFPLESAGPRTMAQAGSVWARCGAVDRARSAFHRLASTLPYPRFQVPQLRLKGEIALAEGNLAAGLAALQAAAALDVRAYGKEYFASALLRAGRREEARAEYRFALKEGSFQLRTSVPEPAGHWLRIRKAVQSI